LLQTSSDRLTSPQQTTPQIYLNVIQTHHLCLQCHHPTVTPSPSSRNCPTWSLDHQLYPLGLLVLGQVRAGVPLGWQRNAAQQLHPMGIADLDSKTTPQLSVISQQATALAEQSVVPLGLCSVRIQRWNWLLKIEYMFQISRKPRETIRVNYSKLQHSRSEPDHMTERLLTVQFIWKNKCDKLHK
jgi:hypothetical protein